MKVTFAEKKVEISEAMREYCEKKLTKLDRYFKHPGDARVVFGTEGGVYKLEITLHHDGLLYRASEKHSDMYAALDQAVASIERQIHKHKTKLEKRLHQNAFEREVPTVLDEPVVEDESEFVIHRNKRFTMRPMTPEEAILQMNLLNHQFFAFKNFANGGSFAVVYRRQGGGYGLIEEE